MQKTDSTDGMDEAELRRRIEEMTRAAVNGSLPDAVSMDGSVAARLAAVAYPLFLRMLKACRDDPILAGGTPLLQAEAAFFRDLLLLTLAALTAVNPLLDAQEGIRLARWCLEEALERLASRGYAIAFKEDKP